MFYSFNEELNITGYIKEKLKEINLPGCRVIKPGLTVCPNRLYIHNDKFVKTDKDLNESVISMYSPNVPVLNITTNLPIENSRYDEKTHVFLGDYLRFMNDYHKFNLLPLFNFLSPNRPKNINISIPEYHIDVDTSDPKYIYYMADVRFDEVYTIAIDCDATYDLFTMIYPANKIDEYHTNLIKETHKRVPGSVFNKPILYDKLTKSQDLVREYSDVEETIKLIIKLPARCKSSVSVLEGDYTNTHESAYGFLTNKVMIQPSLDPLNQEVQYCLNTKLSLTNINDNKQHPFADRLIEYLTNNAISPTSDVKNNIGRLQTMVFSGKDGDRHRTFKGWYDIWDGNLNSQIYHDLQQPAIPCISRTMVQGEARERYNNYNYFDLNYDLLCFGDKVVESLEELRSKE